MNSGFSCGTARSGRISSGFSSIGPEATQPLRRTASPDAISTRHIPLSLLGPEFGRGAVCRDRGGLSSREFRRALLWSYRGAAAIVGPHLIGDLTEVLPGSREDGDELSFLARPAAGAFGGGAAA